MEAIKESLLLGFPSVISYECSKKLIEQMEKNICKIKIGKEQGTGFFCQIPFPNKINMLPVFITNNHIINHDLLYQKNMQIEINIKKENQIKVINLDNRMKYTNEEYDITIIEIKSKDNIKSYLELDDQIINAIIEKKNKNEEYIDNTIYIIQYANANLSVSYGILNNIPDKNYNFYHKCSTQQGSSGSPILNVDNKVIGIHKLGFFSKFFNNNIGIFLNYPIIEFIKSNYDEYKNEIFLKRFNKKYNLDIKDTRVEKISLVGKNIGNDGLEDLIKIQFRELKELNLKSNNITDIKVLEKLKFEKLEKLDLGLNKIDKNNYSSIIGILKFKLNI